MSQPMPQDSREPGNVSPPDQNVTPSPSDDERCRIITADLATLNWAETVPRRFRWLDFIDALAQPVESTAYPEVLSTLIIERRIQGKAAVYREAKELWGLTRKECDAWRIAMAAVYLRLGTTRDPDQVDADGNPIPLAIVPSEQRAKTAAIASLNAMRDALRHEWLEQFGTPIERTRNGVTEQARRPLIRVYDAELNPDNRQAPGSFNQTE